MEVVSRPIPQNSLTDLQKQADALREDIRSVNEDLRKYITPREARLPWRPPAKRSVTEYTQGKLNDIRRLDLEAGELGSSEESGPDDNGVKPSKLPSFVVTTGAQQRPLHAAAPLVNDPSITSRNRRIFGVLRGTLMQFKQDSEADSEKLRRRQEIEKKVDDQTLREREEARNRRSQLFKDRKCKEEELREIERQMDMAALQEEIVLHTQKLTSYIRTKTQPYLFYLPAVHNPRTEQLLQQSQSLIQDELVVRMQRMIESSIQGVSASNTERQSVMHRSPSRSASPGSSESDTPRRTRSIVNRVVMNK